MKIAYVTNLRAPYRTLQLNEFSKIANVELTAYYTDKPTENRKWRVDKATKFIEVDLKGIKIAGKFGYINRGLIDIVKSNDVIVLGCYEQPTYIILSIVCRLFRKKYILSFDGISANRLEQKEKKIKKILKNIVVNHASYIMGNGTVSRRYFNEIFEYPKEKIYNQYLTVDSDTINELHKRKDNYRSLYRKKLGIKDNEKVIIFSGRLIEIKNVESVVRAINETNDKDIILLITGGGELEEYISKVARKLGVRVIITGFIENQLELFKHYFAGDALILPSKYEPWGLVVNEAMLSELPILVSEVCGCSLDLVIEGENGYKLNPDNINDISNKIIKLFDLNIENSMGRKSRQIICEWNFKNSAENFRKIINNFKNIDEDESNE